MITITSLLFEHYPQTLSRKGCSLPCCFQFAGKGFCITENHFSFCRFLSTVWSQVEVSQFNWIWEECTTLLPYENEAAFPNSRLLLRVLRDCNDSGRSGDPLTGLRHIWASITENARDIFRLLVEYQLEEIKSIETVSAQKKSKEKARKGRDEDAAAGKSFCFPILVFFRVSSETAQGSLLGIVVILRFVEFDQNFFIQNNALEEFSYADLQKCTLVMR